jgi:hypothetical protein
VIKATGQYAGRPLLILGLSGENMTRLMADEPISIDLAELDLAPMQVLLVGGRTEDEITAQLKRFTDGRTKFHDERGGTP